MQFLWRPMTLLQTDNNTTTWNYWANTIKQSKLWEDIVVAWIMQRQRAPQTMAMPLLSVNFLDKSIWIQLSAEQTIIIELESAKNGLVVRMRDETQSKQSKENRQQLVFIVHLQYLTIWLISDKLCAARYTYLSLFRLGWYFCRECFG